MVHLHVHTEYSLLDGACKINELIKRAKELKMTSIAITDHGAMYGVIDFYKAAKAEGIKPIIGCEVYTAKRSMTDKVAGVDSDYGHLVLLAKNNEGYKNLMNIVSRGFTEGFYYKPRVDFDCLRECSAHIIALSACLAGDIPQALLAGDMKRARELVETYKGIFGENFYLELQDHGLPEQKKLNPLLVQLAKETGTPLVATNDVHYINREDAKIQDVLLCIQTGKTVDEPDRMRFETDEFYLKSAEEMVALFPYAPEAVKNTDKIADKCNVEFEFGKLHLPSFDVPGGKEPFEYLRELCFEGLAKRYGENIAPEIKEKLKSELDVIKNMGYVDYFLIVWDFVRFAKENNIMVGPGRGSAAGSLVAYCLGITSIDPVRYNLLFERFLNPERISMPDIDIDFCYERRQEVIDYVIQKYGEDHVAQIITFGTMAARAVIRDVGRALGMPYAEVDVIAKMIPMELHMTIERALEINPQLAALYKSDNGVKKLIDTAKALEGMPRHASTHAAGVVISKEPVYKYVPLQKNDDVVTTQFTMGTLEELGLLKMDFLGLRTLTVIRDAISMSGADIDLDKISYDDKEVYDMISRGETDGVFQLESAGMKQFMKELRPESLEDIIAGISLYRPGPMDQIPRYLANKNHPERITYKHPLLEEILDVTYGCIVYQEQVMQIVRTLAGYSMGRADLVRRAMSKKKADVMEQERHNFIYGTPDGSVPGALKKGISEKVAREIFDEMMDFAKYAFNKSHAAAYAVVAYQTAYLKCHYPTAFMAALLNSVLTDSVKISQYIAECTKMGIKILPPDMNKSTDVFTVEGYSIRFGLGAVKNVGRNFIKECTKERERGGPFASFTDFVQRMAGKDLNKRAVEGLIKCGAFDFTGGTRAQLLACYEKTLEAASSDSKRNLEGQLSLFEAFSSEKPKDSFPEVRDFSKREMLNMEKEAIGIYLTAHPLDEYRDKINRISTHELADIASPDNWSEFDGKSTTIVCVITAKKDKITKSGSIMSFLTVEDLTGETEVLVFPKILQKYDAFIKEDNVVVLRGHISCKEEENAKIVAEEFAPADKIPSGGLYIRLEKGNEHLLDRVGAIIKKKPGITPITIYYAAQDKEIDSIYKTSADEELISQIEAVLGKGSCQIVK